MFVMSADSFLLALDMFRSKCFFYSIYIFFLFALEQAAACHGQLPIYQGWYVASPLPPQKNSFTPTIRKVHHESREMLPLGPLCLFPPFLPYPYEIFHVQRIIQQSEGVGFTDHKQYPEIDQYDPSKYEEEGEDDDYDVGGQHEMHHVEYPPNSAASQAVLLDEIRSTPYPSYYYIPDYIHHEYEVSGSVAIDQVAEEKPIVVYPSVPKEHQVENLSEVAADNLGHYHHPQGHTGHYNPETVTDSYITTRKEAAGTTEVPCYAENTTFQEDDQETTPVPGIHQEGVVEEVKEEEVVSASDMSEHQQELLNQMKEHYESSDVASPCDGYFEKNAANLAQMLEAHFDNRLSRGSRSEGSDKPGNTRLFTPILRALKSIFGSFMGESDASTERKDDAVESQLTKTRNSDDMKSEVEVRAPPASTQKAQEVHSSTVSEKDSGATETPTLRAEKEATR